MIQLNLKLLKQSWHRFDAISDISQALYESLVLELSHQCIPNILEIPAREVFAIRNDS